MELCRICGIHRVTQVTKADGYECLHCGYCARWQQAGIKSYLRGKRLLANWTPSQPQLGAGAEP